VDGQAHTEIPPSAFLRWQCGCIFRRVEFNAPEDCFILHTGGNTLWFGRDGRGEVAPVMIADLPGVNFTNDDILIV
jgi:hypothetical protein